MMSQVREGCQGRSMGPKKRRRGATAIATAAQVAEPKHRALSRQGTDQRPQREDHGRDHELCREARARPGQRPRGPPARAAGAARRQASSSSTSWSGCGPSGSAAPSARCRPSAHLRQGRAGRRERLAQRGARRPAARSCAPPRVRRAPGERGRGQGVGGQSEGVPHADQEGPEDEEHLAGVPDKLRASLSLLASWIGPKIGMHAEDTARPAMTMSSRIRSATIWATSTA